MKCGGVNLDRSTPPCVSCTRSTRRNGRSVGGSTFSEEPHATSLTLLRSLLTMNRGFLHLGETKVLKPPRRSYRAPFLEGGECTMCSTLSGNMRTHEVHVASAVLYCLSPFEFRFVPFGGGGQGSLRTLARTSIVERLFG